MKRKIAAIFAADIAGYSRLVAEDEEDMLRRLASYRSSPTISSRDPAAVFFNTAGEELRIRQNAGPPFDTPHA
jgi:hypothetical protein